MYLNNVFKYWLLHYLTWPVFLKAITSYIIFCNTHLQGSNQWCKRSDKSHRKQYPQLPIAWIPTKKNPNNFMNRFGAAHYFSPGVQVRTIKFCLHRIVSRYRRYLLSVEDKKLERVMHTITINRMHVKYVQNKCGVRAFFFFFFCCG